MLLPFQFEQSGTWNDWPCQNCPRVRAAHTPATCCTMKSSLANGRKFTVSNDLLSHIRIMDHRNQENTRTGFECSQDVGPLVVRYTSNRDGTSCICGHTESFNGFEAGCSMFQLQSNHVKTNTTCQFANTWSVAYILYSDKYLFPGFPFAKEFIL